MVDEQFKAVYDQLAASQEQQKALVRAVKALVAEVKTLREDHEPRTPSVPVPGPDSNRFDDLQKALGRAEATQPSNTGSSYEDRLTLVTIK